MFHRHHNSTTTPATTGAPLAPVGFVAAPAGIIPVAPSPPGPIWAVPMVALQQQQPVAADPSKVAQGATGLLNKVKEVLPAPSTISNAVKSSANAVMPSSDSSAKTEAKLLPLNNAPVSMTPLAPLPMQSEPEAFTTFNEFPVNFLKEELPAVIKERIIPIEEESIQPVIHREVERREVHEVLQPIHERQVLPATIEEKQLQAEYRPVIGGYGPRQATMIAPTVEYASTERTQIVRPPIIEETIRKTIIEEVQPVIHREVIKPYILRQTQPIYEKIIEPEIVLKETRPLIEKAGEFSSFQPAQLPASTFNGGKYVFEVDQKTKLSPVGQTSFAYDTSSTSGYGYKGYPGAK